MPFIAFGSEFTEVDYMTSQPMQSERVHCGTIYHDETKTTINNLYSGHNLLLVPNKIITRASSVLGNQQTSVYPRSVLLERLHDLRGNLKLTEKKRLFLISVVHNKELRTEDILRYSRVIWMN